VLAAFPDAHVVTVDEGWEDRWREFHHAVRIGPLWVGPPWEASPEDAIPVVIDPGRAFGTGAHATTRLCLELLAAEERGSLLDVGCGSGVLGIAAVKLGFGPVIALDADEVAVETTAANARANGVELEIHVADARTGDLPAVDLAVANISLDLVEAGGRRLRAGRAITSGYLARDRPELRGHEHAARRELEGWAADLFVRA
jgi:ribosomal protein L11 methyltransferase